MDEKNQYDTFISGWRSHAIKVIAEIKAYSEGWLPNGPSAAVATAIISRIEAIPIPIPENNAGAGKAP